MPSTLRAALTEAAARKGPDMNAIEFGMTRRACEKLGVPEASTCPSCGLP